MSRTIHLHIGRADLVIEIVKHWPNSVILDTETGKRHATLREAVQAVLDIKSPFVPMGCPSPAEDGTCPGHERP